MGPLAVVLAALLWAGGVADAKSRLADLPERELAAIGRYVFQNECDGRIELLVAWNPGEDFLSLGIGHFIWYPRRGGAFHESFPELLADMRRQAVPVPVWLYVATSGGCPWADRDQFLRERNSRRVLRLEGFLLETASHQARFLVRRLERARSQILAAVAPGRRDTLRRRFDLLTDSFRGRRALVDYVNFKGEGLDPHERVAGRGWGLLQVLEEMADRGQKDPVAAFAHAAGRVLRRRAAASPAGGAQRWLDGWLVRVGRYAAPGP